MSRVNTPQIIATRPSNTEAKSAWSSKWSLLLFAITLIAGFFVRHHHFKTVHSWFDESLGLRMAQFSPTEILARSQRNVHPPMHFLLLSGWRYLFGGSLIALRYYSLLWGLMTIIGGCFLARDILASDKQCSNGNFAGVLAAALIALSPLHIHWSQQVKMYSLGTCMTVWSTWFLIRWFQNSGIWRLVCYVFLAATLSLQHHYGTFTVFGQLTFALSWSATRSLTNRNWNSFLAIVITGWTTLSLWALWLPSFLVQRSHVKRGYWIKEFQWEMVFNVWEDLILMYSPTTTTNYLGLLIAQVVFAFILYLLMQKKVELQLIGWLVIIPFLIAVAWSLLNENIFVGRYLINAQVCLLVGVAGLVASIKKIGLRITIAGILLVGSGVTTIQQRLERTANANVAGMPYLIQEIQQASDLNEPILVCNPMLYLNLCAHKDDLKHIYVADRGHSYPHFQGAPVMKDEEYLSILSVENAGYKWVWTIDAENWLGRNWKVNLPPHWHLQEEQRVQEWYATLVIRVYRRETSPSPIIHYP